MASLVRNWFHEDMWWQQWDGANSRIMVLDLATKCSLEPQASFGRDDVSQVSRSSLARTCGFGVSRGSVDTGSPACSGLPLPTAGRGSGWQRGQLCVETASMVAAVVVQWLWGWLGCFLVFALL